MLINKILSLDFSTSATNNDILSCSESRIVLIYIMI